MNYCKLLTILLPLFGRDGCTRRLLDFFNKEQLPFSLFIADGQKNSAQSLVEKYEDLNITYKYYGHDIDVAQFMSKMSQATKEISTPYIMMMDNDDYIDIDGVKYGLDFLIENSDFSSYRGRVNKGLGNKKILYRKNLVIDNELSLDRMLSIIKLNRNGGVYDMSKTCLLQILFDFLEKSGANDFQLLETFTRYWRTIFGKTNRNMEHAYYYHVGGENIIGKVLTKTVDWVSDPKFKESISIYVSGTSNAIKFMQPELNLNDIKYIFCNVFIREIYQLNKKELTEETIQSIIENSKQYDQNMDFKYYT